jgi:arginase
LLESNCVISEPIAVEIFRDQSDEISPFTDSLAIFAKNLQQKINSSWEDTNRILVLGGDHSISVGTGAGISSCIDMKEVGLIWVDAHADCNTPESSISKCITGYPVAVNHGLGSSKLTSLFNSNFLDGVSYIGLRDIDTTETDNLKSIKANIYSILDIVEVGIAKIVKKAIADMANKKYIWLSIDIDSLDNVYFQEGETDVPVTGGLSPRELLYIVNKISETGKLKITDITQLNNLNKQTALITLASRLSELALGLGGFRYGTV